MNSLLNESFVTDLVDEDEPGQPTNVTTISEARLIANRENAKRSSGPRSASGKEIVSGNSVCHGLSGGKFRLLPTELQSDFDELFDGLRAGYAPVGESESGLVLSIAQSLWTARRAAACQERCVEDMEFGDEQAAKKAAVQIVIYIRYQTSHERAHARYLADLRKLQSDRRKAELGFASQKAKEAEQESKKEVQARKEEIDQAKLAWTKARTDYLSIKNHRLAQEQEIKDLQHASWQRDTERKAERERNMAQWIKDGFADMYEYQRRTGRRSPKYLALLAQCKTAAETKALERRAMYPV